MKITMEEPGGGLIEIFDPKLNKIVFTRRLRSAHEVERIKRAVQKTYQVPAQLVEVIPFRFSSFPVDFVEESEEKEIEGEKVVEEEVIAVKDSA